MPARQRSTTTATARTVKYGVDPDTGTLGNALTSNTWYDAARNKIKTQEAGAKRFTKRMFDSLDRETDRYIGFDVDESTYEEATNVDGDTIIVQVHFDYDNASNQILKTTWLRFHNATGTGALNGPSGPQPKARRMYVAMYHDPLGREIGGVALSNGLR